MRQTLAGGPHTVGGMGLRGMRERIGAVGGTLTSGRRETGGFILRATVPSSLAPTSPAPEQHASGSEPTVATLEYKPSIA